MKKLIYTLIALISSSNYASIDNRYRWHSVHINLEQNSSVILEIDTETLKINKFELILKGKKIKINSLWYKDLVQPELDTIKFTWGCGPLTFNKDGKLSDPNCSDHISLDFWPDIPPDSFPNWYKQPEVIFYFKNGVIVERLISRKVSENRIESESFTKKKHKNKN